jgi:hypothetical protein
MLARPVISCRGVSGFADMTRRPPVGETGNLFSVWYSSGAGKPKTRKLTVRWCT